MTLKGYQREVVDEFDRWYGLVQEDRKRASEAKAELERAVRANAGEEEIERVRETTAVDLAGVWREFHGGKHVAEWSDRTDPAGKPIPHVCIQIPTGGGKTRVAAAILKSIGKSRGLVLWMVPTRAIMEQTVSVLKDKAHPIRRLLDTASHNRVEVIRKDEPLTKDRLRDSLCIMPLMQQSANRVDSEFLKIRRDNGMYAGFFPDTDERDRLDRLSRDHPGLDMVGGGTETPRKSLVNVFRMVKPVIILDEAHKASARNFGKWAEFVNNLGPGLVVELSATPNPEQSNILKIVTGRELQIESMIKKHVRVTVSDLNWQGILRQAVDRLGELDDAARDHGTCIRPIMVIRVELTDPGLYRRGDPRVHAFAARDCLVHELGIPPEQVAIKSSATDGLKGQKLMEPDSPIRYIITNNALMEGWDCPFAYMLVVLDHMRSQRAITQLLGRVMRQPCAEYTDVELLDDCYVYCMHDDLKKLVTLVQERLQTEGFTGMPEYVQKDEDVQRRVNKRRQKFQKVDIRLPRVLHKAEGDGGGWADIDYGRHILHGIDWDRMAIRRPVAADAASSLDSAGQYENSEARISTTTDGYDFISAAAAADGRKPKLSEWVSATRDIVPNPWQSARIIRTFWKGTGMAAEEIRANEPALQGKLLGELKRQIVNKAEAVFRAKLRKRTIRFDMHAPASLFKMRGEYEALPASGKLLQIRNESHVQMSLFEPNYEGDFDSDSERKFARYLDESRAIEWWHRVAARGRGEYYLRGWQEGRIYPDFIAVFRGQNERILRIYEIKGRHLDNPDTEYKRKVLKLLEETLNAGNLRVTGGVLKGDFMIRFDDEVENQQAGAAGQTRHATATDLKPAPSV